MLEEADYKKEILAYKEYSNFSPSNSLSIIIVAYNTNKLLLDCLDSLKRQSWQDLEVILIDNGKNDEIKALLPNYPIKYVKLKKNMGVSYGRNLGALESKGSVFAFLDDDGLAHEHYAKNLFEAFQKGNIYGLRGKIKFKSTSIYNFLQGHYDLGDKIIPCFISLEGNCAFRRESFFSVGGWDDDLWGHEGLDLSYRLVRKFGRDGLIYHPGVIIFHDYADSVKKILRKDIRHTEVGSLLEKERPYLNNFMKSYVISYNENYNLTAIDRLRLKLINKLRQQIREKTWARTIAKHLIG